MPIDALPISLGGAGASDGFSSDSQAQSLANTIWDLFLGGSSSTRPFGSAVLDGSANFTDICHRLVTDLITCICSVDLDIENGSNTGYAAFVNQIRSLPSGASKQYAFLHSSSDKPFKQQ